MRLSAWRALVAREWLRMLRQPTRIVATLGTAALFWVLAASGFGGSMRLPSDSHAADSYAAYLLPGMALMIVMFGTVFGAITLIQDRHAGFLQSVLVSPVSLRTVALAKLLPTALLATVQGGVVLAASLVVGESIPSMAGFVLSLVALFLTAVGVLGIGLALAWRVDSIAGFHGVMNLVLLPGWVLSGALFPVEGASVWLGWLMRMNPLYWANVCVGEGLGTVGDAGVLAWCITVGFPIAAVLALLLSMNRRAGLRGSGDA